MLKTRTNGIELAYERLGQGTPLVLIHGHPLDHSIWEPILPLLENDFDLIVPDLRGFGQSQTIRSRYRLVDMAADIIDLLDHLEIRQAAVVGHSMGGYIALACAAVSPSHIRGVGLIASHIFADLPERKFSRYETASEIEKNGVNLLADAFPVKLTTDPSLQKRDHPQAKCARGSRITASNGRARRLRIAC
jgi:3-oxoadipate enol-lactonase